MGSLGDRISWLISGDGFMPHGHCYLWEPALVYLHVVSDFLIGAAYVGIAWLLWALTRRIRVPFSPLVLCFGVFICACGLTHFMEVWTLWTPSYWISGSVKAVTALASVATAIYMLPTRHKIMDLAATARLATSQRTELEEKNRELERLNAQIEAVSAQRLREAEAQFKSVADYLPEPAWSARPDGHIDFYNQRWYEYTGTTFEQMQGWGWKSVHHPETLPEVINGWTRSLATGEPFEMEFPLRGKDGVFRAFLTRVRPLKNEKGEVLRWIGTNTNVDEQRRHAAELREAVKTRDTFLAIASHELRTPLTPLTLQLQSLARKASRHPPTPFVEDVRSYTETTQKMVARLSRLVNALLDVSRIEAGRLGIDLEDVDFAALAREVGARYEPEVHGGGGVEVSAPAELTGRSDRQRLEQVLTNLLDNALKYGSGHPVAVSVTSQQDRVVITVEDRGIGVSEEHVDRIFDKFERAVSDRNYGGLGLGLFITREIVQALGGRITVESREGAGSRFIVRVPLRSTTA